MEELVAAAKLGPAEQLDFDPAAARAEFWKGSGAAMAIELAKRGANCGFKQRGEGGGKQALRRTMSSPAKGEGRVPLAGFAGIPGASEVYRPSGKAWEPRTDDEGQHVPLLGVAGRMGVVRAESPHAAAAFEFLFWLTNPQWGSRVFAGWSRDDPLPPLPGRITASVGRKPRVGNGREAISRAIAETLARRQFLASLRLPGRADYLTALDEAVQAAVRGKQKPAEAPKAAAEKWREINKKFGVEQQRAAYLHSLGLQ